MRLASAEIEDLFGNRLSWRERMAGGPEWLSWEMVASDAARTKLTAYLEATPQPWTRPDDTWRNISFVGDEVILEVTLATLRVLPPPVVSYAVSRVTFVGVGGRVAGFCGAPLGFGDRPWLIVLSAANGTKESVGRVVAHEIAHAWLESEPADGSHVMAAVEHWAMSTQPLELVQEHSPEMVARVTGFRNRCDRNEKRARTLTRAWGFDDPEPLSTKVWP